MRLFKIILGSIDDYNGTKEINVPNSDFVFVDYASPTETVDMMLFDKDGGVVGDFKRVISTTKHKSNVLFDKIRVSNTSTVNAHIYFYVGTGDYSTNETKVSLPSAMHTDNAVQTRFLTGVLTLTQGEAMKNLLSELPANSTVNDLLVMVPDDSANDVKMASSATGTAVTLKKGLAFSSTSSFNIYFGTAGTESGDTSKIEYAIGYI